jgi:hypothetical protein
MATLAVDAAVADSFDGVLLRKFVTTQAMRLACIDCGRPFANESVLNSRYWIEMFWVEARSVSALMVQYHPLGDSGSSKKLIGDDVGRSRLPIHRDSAVAIS